MRAAVYRGPDDLRIETVPVPQARANELLVKVAVCGVCPTDIKKIHYGTVPPPRIFGHETAGTIVKLGAGSSARGFKIGDRVALHHHVPCLDCHACRHRAFAQCETYKRTGITAGFEPAGGGFAEYVRVMPFVLPGVVKIPARNSFEEGAMLEPVNTVLKAVHRLALLPGDKVLVAGQGPIGLMFTRLLQLRGMKVFATDLMEARLKLARGFGAKWAARPDLFTQVAHRLTANLGKEKSKPRARSSPPGDSFRHPLSALPFDAAVLAVPSDAALAQAFQSIRGGGQILLFAHTKRNQHPRSAGRKSEISGQKTPPQENQPRLPFDLASVCVDEKDLIGSYSADFTIQPEVAKLVFSRQLDVRQLITHRFPLAQTADAVRLASNPGPDSLKILVCP